MKDILYQAGLDWNLLSEQDKQVYREESSILAA
jgi:hypothetical protein